MSIDSGLCVLADDLSGAAEAAITLGPPVPVLMSGASAFTVENDSYRDLTVDLDCRYLSPAEARARTAEALSVLGGKQGTSGSGTRSAFIKIDSLLRGNVRAHIEAALEAALGPVIFAPTLPQQNRTVVDQVPFIDGQPLETTRAWDLEDSAAPSTLGDLCPESPEQLDLDDLRTLSISELSTRFGASRLITADAETMADLERVVKFGQNIGAVFVGSAALARAYANRRTAADQALTAGARSASGPRSADHRLGAGQATTPRTPVLFLLGTAAHRITAQIEHLRDRTTIGLLEIPAAEVLGWRENPVGLAARAKEIRDMLSRGDLVVRLGDDGTSVNPRPLPALLAELAAQALTDSGPIDLVTTGGETARAVLNRLTVSTLITQREIHPGAVLSTLTSAMESDRKSDITRIVTRPGGQGDDDSLTQILNALRDSAPGPRNTPLDQLAHQGEPMNALPTVAVTMGDAAGVGPEICIAACLDPSVLAVANPVIIGDTARLKQAAEVTGTDVDIRTIATPAEAEHAEGVINVIDLELIPTDLPWGELSSLAGDAAFRYIERAAALAMSGEVQAICTAPLNKEALHAAGHKYPGHTEMLAALTGTEEVSMMLSSPKLRVIHVTTHIGLIDAVAKIEPGLVERTVRRGHDALVRAGIEQPHIGVCAINPHAGENGLFGYGEEAEKITPAIDTLQAAGIDAVGPLPADTAFFLAGRGDYDLIVAMYHDQGHGPIKVLGIDAGVNITVGLPVIRTSVDHGTAFDIAGTGKADTESMSEAMRQAAALAGA